jgi:mannose-6-phosphate isomerase-like protein (cupin superfamily)
VKFGKVSLAPGEKMKEHSNGESEELLIIVKGTARVFAGGKTAEISGGESFLIPANTIHAVENIGAGQLEYFYVLPRRN